MTKVAKFNWPTVALEAYRRARPFNRPSTGIVSSGPYQGQEYEIIAARRGFPSWYRVIIKDASGVVERETFGRAACETQAR